MQDFISLHRLLNFSSAAGAITDDGCAALTKYAVDNEIALTLWSCNNIDLQSTKDNYKKWIHRKKIHKHFGIVENF